MKQVKSGGGWRAVWYTLKKARQAGGVWKLWKALRAKNACKTCALGMGGQRGGMVNEAGHRFEVCKKSIQAMVADMQGRVREDFFDTFSIQQLKAFTPRELEYSGRLAEPLYAAPGATHYKAIAWEEAFDKIAANMRATSAEDSFFYFSGRSSNEAAFLLQLFARLYGTNNVNNCSYYCHQASGVGLASVTGSGTATVALEDLDRADLVFLIGGNPASNHPRLMTVMHHLRRRGGKVIVINPLKETGLVNFRIPSKPLSLLFGSKIADLYVQPRIGGDIALLAGVAKLVLERGGVDKRFVTEHAEGWESAREWLERLGWDEITANAGVGRVEINRVAELYLQSKNTIFAWAMGITHHEHGVQNVQMIANLAMMRGMLGRRGAGLMPIRGHSNVQGIGSIGAVPNLKETVLQRLQTHFDVRLPTAKGLDTMGCMLRADAGRVKFALCLGGNLYGSNPDSAFAAQALNKIDMVVYLNTTLNQGHAHGCGRETLILPVLARDEEQQPTTQESMFNFVRLSEGGATRHAGLRGEVEIVAEIAQRVLGGSQPVDWRSMQQHGNIRRAIAAIVPGFEKMAEIDATKREFHIDGRIFHEPKFPTAGGKAVFHTFALPAAPQLGARELLLMTIRSEGQFNTVVHEEEDLYRGQERRDVILMNAKDIARLGLAVNRRVTVRSATGAIGNILVREYDIAPGNAAMYYPEVNVLVPRGVDPLSFTPAFKAVKVAIEG